MVCETKTSTASVANVLNEIVESNDEHAKDVESFGKESNKNFYYVYH